MHQQAARFFKVLVVLSFSLLGTSASLADEITRSGSFYGINNHTSSGTASIVKQGDNYVIVLGEDFVFDGAPDPKMALGKDGAYDSATLMGLLKSNTGQQSFVIPASIDVSAYNEVHIWCERYSVGLAVAPLK